MKHRKQSKQKKESEVKSLSRVRLFATPWTVAYQAFLSMGFSRQEYQSGLPFPSPGDLPDPGIKPRSPALEAGTLISEPPGTQKASLQTKLVEVMEFQLSCFKSWKMMLWKGCTQYASKFGKLSSGHRTGKGQFSFQSQKKEMPKNAQTTTQLHSSHTLVE